MRSRYSAYALDNVAYLLQTWAPATRPRSIILDPDQHWTRLEIIEKEAGSMFDDAGIVGFRAHFTRGAHAHSLLERSRFERVDGAWCYVEAQDAQLLDE